MSDDTWVKVSDDTAMYPAFAQRTNWGVIVAHGNIGSSSPDLTTTWHDYSVVELEWLLALAKGETDG